MSAHAAVRAVRGSEPRTRRAWRAHPGHLPCDTCGVEDWTVSFGDLLVTVGVIGFIVGRLRDAWHQGRDEGLLAKLAYIKGSSLGLMSWGFAAVVALGLLVMWA